MWDHWYSTHSNLNNVNSFRQFCVYNDTSWYQNIRARDVYKSNISTFYNCLLFIKSNFVVNKLKRISAIKCSPLFLKTVNFAELSHKWIFSESYNFFTPFLQNNWVYYKQPKSNKGYYLPAFKMKNCKLFRNTLISKYLLK